MAAVTHEGDDSTGKFLLVEDDKTIGWLSYSISGDHEIIIDHTKIEEQFRGKGFGKKLLDSAAQTARKNKYKIIPTCSFAKKIMESDSTYKDVLS